MSLISNVYKDAEHFHQSGGKLDIFITVFARLSLSLKEIVKAVVATFLLLFLSIHSPFM